MAKGFWSDEASYEDYKKKSTRMGLVKSSDLYWISFKITCLTFS